MLKRTKLEKSSGTIGSHSEFLKMTLVVVVGGLAGFHLAGTAGARDALDSINFGDRESEQAHRFISENSEIPEEIPIAVDGPYVQSVTATDGTAPQATLTENGEWAVHNNGEWIEYALSELTEIDRVEIAWGRGQTFFFEIHASSDGERWERVYEGASWRRGSGHFETCEFDPVQVRHVRIVARGRDSGRSRTGRFFIAQVRIGNLPYPEAYQPALAYRPGLNQPSRRLLPVADSWEGGWMRFVMKCEPDQKNYLTVKLWGSDNVMSPLYLRDKDGRWVAAPAISMHRTGDNAAWTPLWEFAGGVAGGPLGVANGPFPGRFIYATYPIPREMTQGRSEVTLQIQAVGSEFERPMFKPSQGIYAAYTHTEPFSHFADDEPQGEPFEWGPNRPAPQDLSVEEKLMNDALDLIADLVERRGLSAEDYRGLESLAQAYHAEWSDHYRDEEIVRIVRDTIDASIRNEARSGQGPSWTDSWHLHGKLAIAFVQVSGAFEEMGFLDQRFEGERGLGYAYVSRRHVYAKFFQDALEWRRSESEGTRRRVANQVESVDRAIYRMNRALQILSPELAMPEEAALRYLYETIGMEPFYSAWPRHEWVRAVADAGYPFYVVSYKGNAREVGLGTSYGEGAPSRNARLAAEIGDEKFTERVRQLAEARATMTRRPANDGAGYAVLRAPVVYGWRGRSVAYPGLIRYTGSPFIQAAILQDPISLRIAELYLEQGRVFAEETPRINQIIPRIEAYRTVKQLLPTNHRLPMEPGHEDFAWADEDLAVFAAKHGEAMISGSFFLDKAGIVPYGRIHYTTPQIERIATVKVDTKFNAAEHTYTIPDQLPGGRENVLGGRQRPAAAPPPDLIEAAGSPPGSVNAVSEAGGDQWIGSDERSSMADFYQVRFGEYLVAMNTTVEGTYREQTFVVDVDSDKSRALNLASGETIDLTGQVELGPRSTLVLYLGKSQ